MFDFILTNKCLFDIMESSRTNVPNNYLLMEVFMNASVYPMTKRELLLYRKQLNHKKVLRRRIAVGILSILLVLLFVLSFNSIMAQATEELPETTYKYFTYYTIEKGDTLWKLAEEYIDYNFYKNIQEYVSEVKEINHMTDDSIRAGHTLVIPYFSTIYQ